MARYNDANNSFVDNNKTIFEAVMIANSSGSILNSFGGGSSGNVVLANSTNFIGIVNAIGSGLPTGANTIGSVSITGGLGTGANTIGSVQGSGAVVEVVPTVNSTASYANGNVMGGVMTFANILPLNNFNGVLESISLKFKNTVQTGQYQVALFSSPPTGTFTDKTAPAIANTDSALLVGAYNLTNPQSALGTHTIYNLDGIGKQVTAASNSLYAVVVANSGTTVNCTTTTDMSLRLGFIW